MAQVANKFKVGNQVKRFDARTRQEALQSVLSGKNLTASHNHVVSPLVHAAASQIIKNQRSLDLELFDLPYEVLEQASIKLESAGIEAKLARRALDALEEYILNMGVDFSREVKAKPLYARFKVTNVVPEDLPDCEQSQATLLDGLKNYGSEAANIKRYMSIFGPKSTSSFGVDLDTMFASKQTGLFVFFGSPSNEAVKGFDSIDASLMNAMQAAGGSLSPEEMTELKEMIENGELSPEALQLLENLAELAQLKEIALDPDMLPEVEGRLSELAQEISEQISLGIEQGTLPEFLATAATTIVAETVQNNSLNLIADVVADNENSAPELETATKIESLIEKLSELLAIEGLDPEIIAIIETKIELLQNNASLESAEILVLLNDIKSELSDMAALEDLPVDAYSAISEILPALSEAFLSISLNNATLLEQLSDLAAAGSDELLEIIKQLSQTESPPAEIKEILDKINIEEISPEIIARAIEAGSDTELGALIQNLIIEISSPEIQAQLSQEVLNSVNSFMESKSELIEAIAVQSTVQNLEAVLDGLDTSSPEAQAIQNTINELKDVQQSISEVDITSLAGTLKAINPEILDSIQPAIDRAVDISESVTSKNVILANETIEAIERASQDPNISSENREKIEQAIKIGNEATILEVLSQTPEIIQTLPPTLQESLAVAVKSHSETLSNVSTDIALSANTVSEIQAAVEKTDISEAVKADLNEALAAGDTAKVAEIIQANPDIADALPAEVKTDIGRMANSAPDTTSAEISADKVADIQAAVEKADISEAVKADLNEALAAGDTAKVAEIIQANPDIADALPTEVKTDIGKIANSAPDTTSAEISADKVADIQAAVEKADISEAVKADLNEALAAGDSAKVAEIIQANPDIADALPAAVKTDIGQVTKDVAESTSLDTGTNGLSKFEANIEKMDLPSDVKAEINIALKTNDTGALTELIAEHPELGNVLPEAAKAEPGSVLNEDSTNTNIQSLDETAGVQKTEPSKLEGEFSALGNEDTVIHAAEVFAQAAEKSSSNKNIGPQQDAEIIDLRAHRDAPKTQTAPELAIADIPTPGQAVPPTPRADFEKVSPPTGENVATIQLDNSVNLTAATNNYEVSKPDINAIPAPDQDIAGHPPGCMCPACAGADLGAGKEADLTAATNNYEVSKPDINAIPAPDQDIAGHPPGCMCPACAGADLGAGKEADLTNTKPDYTAEKDGLGIPSPEITKNNVDSDASIDISETEGQNLLDIPQPQQKFSSAPQIAI